MDRTVRPTRAAALCLAGALCGAALAQAPPAAPGPEPHAAEGIQVPPPPFTEGIFPCTGCHDGKSVPLNATPRKLVDMHDDIVLNHGPKSRWCLDCHNAADRDTLHLVSGEVIPFTESYRLCGQCHGDKYRDWRVGVHGKRTGHWDGEKQYLLCAHCHNPHAPHFAPLKPEPPPLRPEQVQPKTGGAP